MRASRLNLRCVARVQSGKLQREVHSASRSAYVRAQQRLCAHNKDCESCQIVASTSTDKKGMIVVRISVSTQGAWCFSFARTPVSTWGAFCFFFCVSLCAPPSQPGVRSFCFCAHPRLNLGCVLFFFCVSLCAPPSQPGVRSFWFCAHLRLNLGCVVTCKNSIIAISISTSVDRVAQRSGEIHVHTKTVASHTDRKNADERKEPHQPRG